MNALGIFLENSLTSSLSSARWTLPTEYAYEWITRFFLKSFRPVTSPDARF